MSNLSSMLTAMEVATRKRDEAAQVLARAQRDYLSAQGQMNQLQGYAQETESRWSTRAQTSATPALMQHHYQFMDKLHHAMDYQRNVLEQQARHIENLRQELLQQEYRVVTLRAVCEKMQAQELAGERRREQKQIDEMASLMRGRASALSLSGGSL